MKYSSIKCPTWQKTSGIAVCSCQLVVFTTLRVKLKNLLKNENGLMPLTALQSTHAPKEIWHNPKSCTVHKAPLLLVKIMNSICSFTECVNIGLFQWRHASFPTVLKNKSALIHDCHGNVFVA